MKTSVLIIFCCLPLLSVFGQVNNGLIAKYSFNNGDANDEVGTNHGTVSLATLTTDRFGNANKAYSFNGNGYINCGDGTEYQNLTKQYTISAWFKKDSFQAGYQVIASKWAFNSASEHFWLSMNGNKVAWASAGPMNNGTLDTTNNSASNWHHVVFTWDSTGLHQVYIDNVLTTSRQSTPYTINVTSSVNMYIGAQSPATREFMGDIDDVRVYNRVLSVQDIDSLYNEANPMPVAVNNLNFRKAINCYPNPTTGQVTLDLGKHFEQATVEVFNLLGQLVYSHNYFNTEQINLNLNAAAGTYFVRIRNEEGEATLKLIKE